MKIYSERGVYRGRLVFLDEAGAELDRYTAAIRLGAPREAYPDLLTLHCDVTTSTRELVVPAHAAIRFELANGQFLAQTSDARVEEVIPTRPGGSVTFKVPLACSP